MLSTRPPPTLGASLENKKRIRSGSISLSLQHVSELLEEGVLENREQKGVVKDLIISGNEEILEMIHQYNQNGDKKPIQRLVRSYSFNRKSSLDLLGDDLTLEFAELLFPKPQQQQQQQQQPQAQENEEDVLGSEEHDAADLAVSQQQRRQDFRDDDEFEAYDVMLLGNEDQEDLHSILRTPPFRPVAFAGKQTSSQQQQQQQQRMRSCSLSSTSFFQSLPPAREESMLNMLLEGDDDDEDEVGDDELMPSRSNAVSFFGNVEPDTAAAAAENATTGEVDLLDDVEEIEDIDEEYNDDEEEMRRPPPTPMRRTKNQTKPMQIPKPNKSSTAAAAAIAGAPAQPLKKRHTVVPQYSPPVSSPSPPDSTSHIPALPTEEDIAYKRSLGIVMTGAYSPESRATRVGRFVDKRDQRVWKKKVKYDVRKNFADSRLRVKGRFVKKEDEEMLREFMCFV